MRMSCVRCVLLFRIISDLSRRTSPAGGRVEAVGSKNLAAPCPNVAAFSVSKAAINQLIRVAVLEWDSDGIRINSIHPNAVFDAGIWSPEVIRSRAKSYNLTVEEYKKNNLLRTTVTAQMWHKWPSL